MNWITRLLGISPATAAKRPAASPAAPTSNQNRNPAALSPARSEQAGWELVRDDKGAVNGFWFAELPPAHLELQILKMAAASEDLDEGTAFLVYQSDYRKVANNDERKGGTFIMIGPAIAPGERLPPLESIRWTKGKQNPSARDVARLGSATKFACPLCQIPNYCFDKDLDDLVGTIVQCPHCGEISHVPGAFKSNPNPAGVAVRGCVFVPIAQFGDWFYSHPLFSPADAEVYGSYGLHALCAKCKHRYNSTVLPTFSVASEASSMFFNAHSEKSAADMRGLLDKKCPSCGDSNLLALLVEIPASVRESIAAEKRRRGM